MTRIYRWSMMVYSSLQAEFMVTKYDGHIHRFVAPRIVFTLQEKNTKILQIIKSVWSISYKLQFLFHIGCQHAGDGGLDRH